MEPYLKPLATQKSPRVNTNLLINNHFHVELITRQQSLNGLEINPQVVGVEDPTQLSSISTNTYTLAQIIVNIKHTERHQESLMAG